MISHKRINGLDIRYSIVDPSLYRIYAAYNPGDFVAELGKDRHADIAINFNYANTQTGAPIGRLIVDGKEVVHDIPKTVPRDDLYMMPDGTLHIGKAPAGVLWAVQGSPPLLRNGRSVVSEGIQRDQLGADVWQGRARRTAVGIAADGQLVLVSTIDEMYLPELADIMLKLGCVDALNGDGGGSSYMWPEDTGWGRKLGSALIVKRRESKVKPILIIDPGHGGKDPGGGSNQYWQEKNMVLDISLYQLQRFKDLGVPVTITRNDDTYLGPEERTCIIRDSCAQYCISNHINAGGGDGVETIHSIYANDVLAAELAQAISKEGQNIRRVFTRTLPYDRNKDYYFMHRDTGSVNTTIIEYGFADSKKDDVKQLQEHWKDYAEAVVKAFCQHIGHAYAPPHIAGSLPAIQSAVTVQLNGKPAPVGYLIDNTTYVPLRIIGEALGARIGWDGKTKTATIEEGGK